MAVVASSVAWGDNATRTQPGTKQQTSTSGIGLFFCPRDSLSLSLSPPYIHLPSILSLHFTINQGLRIPSSPQGDCELEREILGREMLCINGGDWEKEEDMGITISPPTNVWPQAGMMATDRILTTNNSNRSGAATSGGGAVADHQQPQPAVQLKCPRCDSSNTKFCYYNNYSLSQPRHFCKACKRYWTRGGTLRNVPVGGGCRKNKRIKKSSSTAASAVVTSRSDQLPTQLPPLSLPINTAITDISSLLYGLPSEIGTMTYPTYDLQSQLNALGLSFHLGDHVPQLQQTAVGSTAPLLNDYQFFGSSLPTTAAASLLVSSLKQQQYHEDLHASGNGGMGMLKNVKVEDEANAMNGVQIDWQIPCEGSFESVSADASVGATDSSFYYWNPTGVWPETAICGSSVTPLI